MTNEADHRRARILQAHGTTGGVVAQLPRDTGKLTSSDTRSLLSPPDEPYLEAWTGYVREALVGGTTATLKGRLVHLRVPIRPSALPLGNLVQALPALSLEDLALPDLTKLVTARQP